MDEELVERLRALMGRVPADATAAPVGRPVPQPTIGPMSPGTPPSPRPARGLLAAVARSAQAGGGLANELLNPVRAGASARQMVNEAIPAARQGNIGRAAGLGALAAMSVPGVPGPDDAVRTARAVTDSPQFREFFRESRAVNPDGSPRVFVHATNRDFDTFRPGGDNPNASGRAIFLTSRDQPGNDVTMVPAYHNIGGNIEGTGEFKEGTNFMPLYASVQNPLVITKDNYGALQMRYSQGEGFPVRFTDDIINRLRAEGYDGVWNQKPFLNFPDELVVFDPTQVKSATGNSGAFSRTDPRITAGIAAILGLNAANRSQQAQNR